MNFVRGSVRRWLRFEGAAIVAASLVFYRYEHASWVLFAVLFLAPDLAMLGYLAGSRVGAAAYNFVHNYVLPLVLLMAVVLTGRPTAAAYALIWTAHIGFDRMLGYGLKYPSSFGETHLGRLGKLKAAESMTS
jgi:Domain of unknown function (DUF4260)